MWLTHLPMSIYILEKLDGGFTEPRKKKKKPHDGKVETRKQIQKDDKVTGTKNRNRH